MIEGFKRLFAVP